MSNKAKYFLILLPLFMVCLWLSNLSLAQVITTTTANDYTNFVTTATHVENDPVLDGNVLNEPAWQAASPLTDFWQTTPN